MTKIVKTLVLLSATLICIESNAERIVVLGGPIGNANFEASAPTAGSMPLFFHSQLVQCKRKRRH